MRSNHPTIMWISLEARYLNNIKNLSSEPCKYVFSYILDDRIIGSWCLDILNTQFNVFYNILCFDQNFRRLIDPTS